MSSAPVDTDAASPDRLAIQLAMACKEKDLAEVRRLVEVEGARFDQPTADGRGPGLVAVSTGDHDLLNFMLSTGVEVTDQMVQNAVLRRKPDIALLLLRSENPKKYRTSWLKDTRTFANDKGQPDVAKEVGLVLKSLQKEKAS